MLMNLSGLWCVCVCLCVGGVNNDITARMKHLFKSGPKNRKLVLKAEDVGLLFNGGTFAVTLCCVKESENGAYGGKCECSYAFEE